MGKIDFVWRGNRGCLALLRLGDSFHLFALWFVSILLLACTLWGTCFPSFQTPLVSWHRLTKRVLIVSRTDKMSSSGHRQDGPALLFQNKSQAGNVSSNRGKVELFLAEHISISEGLEDETIPGFLSFSVLFKELGRPWFPELLNLQQRNLVYSVFKGILSSLTIIIVIF